MTAPALAGARFLWACVLGVLLGAVYDFLGPLRRKMLHFSDLLFSGALLWGWLYLAFGICRGDPRPGYGLGMLLGFLVFRGTLGKLLTPVFGAVWGLVFQSIAFALLPGKKIYKNVKILFASAEKWVTIKWSNRRHLHGKFGGRPYGKDKRILPQT